MVAISLKSHNFVSNIAKFFYSQLRNKQKNYNFMLIMCPSLLKSLVKGERFIANHLSLLYKVKLWVTLNTID